MITDENISATLSHAIRELNRIPRIELVAGLIDTLTDLKSRVDSRRTVDVINKNLDFADNVNSPAHYNHGNIECIDIIEASLTAEEFRGYCKGNVIKYTYREREKGQDESLLKAEWYLKRAVGVKK